MEKLYNILDRDGCLVEEDLTEDETLDIDENFTVEESGNVIDDFGTLCDKDELLYTEDGYDVCADNAWEDECSGDIYSKDEPKFETQDGYISQKTIDNGVYVLCYHKEVYIDRDYASWCVDVDEFVHENYATWCSHTDAYYYDEDNIPASNNVICEYHCSPKVENLNTFGCKFQIGFEIEKQSFGSSDDAGDFVGDYSLFKGFETDSSCGVEAITNILPLSLDDEPLSYVKKLFNEASAIIDEEHVNQSCGGHINLSVRGYDADNLYDKIRSSMAVFYALYRHRLSNDYCDSNKRLDSERKTAEYSPLKLQKNYIEIRLPNAVKNKEQLLNRYKLCYEILYHNFNTNHKFSTLLKKITYILNDMYDNDETKVKNIKKLAKYFWRYLVMGEIHEDIKEFV